MSDRPRGYLASAVGGAVGASFLGIAGALVGIGYAGRFLDGGLEALGPYFAGMLVGAWAGASFGSAVALRLRGHASHVRTGAVTAILFPLGVLLVFFVARRGVSLPEPVVMLVPLVQLVAVPLAARAIVVRP